MTDADGRLLLAIFPQAPKDEAGILSWARNLVVSLTKFQKQRERIRCIEKVYAATLEADSEAGNIFKTTTINATGNSTINAASAAAPNWLAVVVVNDATSGKTITFGTGFKSSGVLVGTASKTAIVFFISDGSSFLEVARTTGLT